MRHSHIRQKEVVSLCSVELFTVHHAIGDGCLEEIEDLLFEVADL